MVNTYEFPTNRSSAQRGEQGRGCWGSLFLHEYRVFLPVLICVYVYSTPAFAHVPIRNTCSVLLLVGPGALTCGCLVSTRELLDLATA